MNEKYIKKSVITGRTYDLFKIVRILNPAQTCFYLERQVPLQDIEISEDKKTGKPIMVYFFNREDTKEVYDEWCNNNSRN